MTRVGEIRWHSGSFHQCVADDDRAIVWAAVDPVWLDWHCIPAAWVKRKPS